MEQDHGRSERGVDRVRLKRGRKRLSEEGEPGIKRRRGDKNRVGGETGENERRMASDKVKRIRTGSE
jgi:hypothetical protein